MPANAAASESIADREVVITRTHAARRRLLLQAESTLCEVDFRVGGRFRFAMTGPSGQQNTPFGGEYLEIVPNRKIVFDNAFEAPGAEKMIMTVTFDEKGGKTLLAFHTLFASVAMKKAHVDAVFFQGAGSGLDQLAYVVAAMTVGKA